MARKISAPPQSIGRALNFATGRMNSLCQQLLDSEDLSLPQWVVLSCLWRDEEMTISELAGLVGNGLPAMSRIIDRMVVKDLVVRQKDEDDDRVSIVALTKKGNDLRHLSNFHERINEILFEGFSSEERFLAFSLLSKMQINAEKSLKK